ncbi:MAG: hypothetical protein ACREQL_10950 [Candidatus Binatia bacterium]
MMRIRHLALAGLLLASSQPILADQQQIAPGTGQQNSVVIDAGPDGICNTVAAEGDILLPATIGLGSPNRTEVRCGPNKIVDTIAAGDDVQLIALGAACKNANNAIVDTGANGVPDTPLSGDDTYAAGIVFGVPPSNTPCVITGADGVAQTAAPAGDDVQQLVAGAAEPNTAVILCGPNLIADTTANNFAAGDDVQLVPVGNACTANQVVVDSGTDGIAATRAEGPDLRISAAKPVKINISGGRPNASKFVKFTITNTEFGATAPIARTYKITTTSGSCGGGVVTQVDADSVTPGLQATGTAPLGSRVKATLVATMKLQNVTTTASNNPFRCTFNVTVVALDTDPDVDDGANDDGNTTTVDLEVNDRNDY